VSKPPLRVVVLIDALGWTYVENREFLNEWLPHRQPLRTVLGYSSGAIPTLLTGELPSRHGHWNLFYYDPAGSPFRGLRRVPLLTSLLFGNRVGRRVLKEIGRRFMGLGPLFEVCVEPRLLPYLNFVEKKNIYEPGGVTGAPTLFDRLAASGVRTRVYTYHRYRDDETLERAPREIAAGEADYYFLYLSEIDHALHHHCHEPAVVEERMRSYSQRLARVFAEARRRDPRARLCLFSDHGMTPVSDHFPLVQRIEALGLRMPSDYLAVYDSTMARFWFFNDDARNRIHAELGRLPCGRVLSDAELQGLGILFPDRRYGQTIFLLDPGVLLTGSGFNGGGWTPAGMHGYHPDDRWSDGVYLADQAPEAAVASVVDVHRTLQAAA